MESTTGKLTWQTVRIFMILSLIQGWASRQLDFVMADPQSPAEKPLYMCLPRGYHHQGISKDTHVLKLVDNIYGQKQARHVWNQHLDEGMKEGGFSVSEYDPCLYYRQNVIMFVYIYDCIMFSLDPQSIDNTIKDLQHSEKKFVIDDQWDVSSFLGIEVSRLEDGLIKLLQPHLIN